MNSTKKEISMRIGSIPVRMKFLGLWKRIETLWNQDMAINIGQIIVDDLSNLEQYINMSDNELREYIQLLGFQDQSINKVKESKKQMQLSNPQKKDELQIKQMVIEQLPLAHYSQEIKRKLEEGHKFNKFLTNSDFQMFFKGWESYVKTKVKSREQILLKDTDFFSQLLEVDSALYHSTKQGHRIRITQALALFCFLGKTEIKREILQILTGQGKSTTISCLAAMLTAKGLDVDILTTNDILARRDVEEKSQFFKLLGLKVAHNFGEEPDKPKKCYEKNTIVYGTPHSFQVDFLYNQYKRKGTRSNRQYIVIIIDESDSMFVDEKQHQTLLSTRYTGFSQLHLPMRIIWQYIVSEQYVIDHSGKITMYMHGEKDQIIEAEAKTIMNKIMEGIRQKFQNQIIPVWRMDFVNLSLESWIYSALNAAYHYKEKIHYLVQDGDIAPIDFQNTGTIMNKTQWQNGLHQFLQMKHGLNITTQGMTSNFISNISYFSRYSHIFGMTGTLGGEKARQFLVDNYDVNLLEIPTFKERKLLNLQDYLLYDENDWFRKIEERIEKVVLEEERSALIMCESIQLVELLENRLKQIKFKSRNQFKNIRTLKTGEQNFLAEVDCCEIIIATNIAGRGTDIKISENLRKKNGFHVILTFIPQNQRVQKQARGRAGRNGDPGTSEIIACYKIYCQNNNMMILQRNQFNLHDFNNHFNKFLEITRDQIEESKMQNDTKIVSKLKTLDKAFEIYCKGVNKIPKFHDNRALREAIEEKWAMFLKQAEIKEMSNQQIQKKATQLVQQFESKPQDHYNPNHSVLRGINLMCQGNKQKAQKFFEEVQQKDTNLNCQISGNMLGSTNLINMNPKDKGTIQKGLANLLGTKNLIKKRKDIIQAVHNVSESTNNDQIRQFLENQQQDEINKLRNSLQKSDSFNQKELKSVQAPSMHELNAKKFQKLTDIAEIHVLNEIEKHIDKQQEVYKNLKKGEWVQFSYQPISEIIDKIPGKEKQVQNAIQKANGDGLTFVPKAEVKKEKAPFWKRALVFCFGVLQICVGALILNAAGSVGLQSFASSMITRGVQCCFDALFNPEVCNDLKKYFTQKALEYTVDLALLGPSGIQQLKNLGTKSLNVIKNKSMKEVMEIAKKGIKSGLEKYPGGFEHMVKQRLFEGLKSKGVNKMAELGKQFNKESVVTAIKNPQLKNVFEKGMKEESEADAINQKYIGQFSKNLKAVIRTLIQNNSKLLLNLLSKGKIEKEQKQILIHNILISKLAPVINPQNSQEHKKLYQKVILFMSMNLKSNKPGQKYLKNFKLDQLITSILKELQNSKQLKTIKGNHQMQQWADQIINELNSSTEKLNGENKVLVNQINNLVQRYNKQKNIDQLEKIKKQHDQKVAKHKLYTKQIDQKNKQVQKINKDFESIIKSLFSEGLLPPNNQLASNRQLLKKLERFPKSIQQAVISLSKKNKGINQANTDLDLEFQQMFIEEVFQKINRMPQKAGYQVSSYSSKSPNYLQEIQQKLTKAALG